MVLYVCVLLYISYVYSWLCRSFSAGGAAEPRRCYIYIYIYIHIYIYIDRYDNDNDNDNDNYIYIYIYILYPIIKGNYL